MSILIETKVKSFATDITARLKKKRDAKIAALKKKNKGAGDLEKTVTNVKFAYSSAKGSIKRSPTDQAEGVSKGKSWTCAGAHVADKARHVKMQLTEPGKSQKVSWDLKKAFGTNDHHFITLAEVKTEWAAAMKKQDLKNFKGKDGWGAGDEFHLELPDSKIPRTHKDVQTCLDHYAKITIIDGRPINLSFEKSWKKHLKPFQDKYQKIKDAERLKELLKYRTSGETLGSGQLVRKASKNTKFKSPTFSNIEPPSPLETGKRTTKLVKANGEVVWDSLARSIFEKIGLSPTSGFDVKVLFELSYILVDYELLSQSFLCDLSFRGEVVYNTPAARFMGMDIKYDLSAKLAKSSLVPTGVLKFDILLEAPLNNLKATVGFGIKGNSVGVKVSY